MKLKKENIFNMRILLILKHTKQNKNNTKQIQNKTKYYL